MKDKTAPGIEKFSSRLTFVLAAVGAAVGLGNVWKFPFEAGKNGGAAFVLVYLIGLLVISAPIFVAEVMIGRRGAASPPETLKKQALEHGRSAGWRIPGLFGLFAGLLIVSFYSVVAGWTLDYMVKGASGLFAGLDAAGAKAQFADLQASVPRLLLWQGSFILMTLGIVALGVKSGIERAVTVMTPALGFLLIALVVYALIEGAMADAVAYLFAPDFSKLSPEMVMAALGQAFFTLSVGIGGVMMFGAYLPNGTSIFRASFLVILADTAVAMLAGLAVFPVVFANGLDPAGGPGLVFVTLPLAFAGMPFGGLLGTLFFFFLFLAALTSAISLYEPTAAWFSERGLGRMRGTVVAGTISWLLGLLSVFSFNIWADFYPLDFFPALKGMTFFALITEGIDKLVLPIGALLIAWFAGRVLSRRAVREELGVWDGSLFRLWLFAIRWVTPIVITVLFVANFV